MAVCGVEPEEGILQILLIVVLLLLLAFILIGRFAPTLLDPLLYNAEELEILRY